MRLLAYCALVLALASTCFADSLLVTASADGFIYPPAAGGTAGAKSFTIVGNAATLDMTLLDGGGLGAKAFNYGTTKTLTVGKASGDKNICMRFPTLDDSMKALDVMRNITWDSANIYLTVYTRPDSISTTARDSLIVSAYKLNTNRVFGEGTSDGAAGLGASWFDYDSTSGVQALWTTAGSGTSDYNSTAIGATRWMTYTDYTHSVMRLPIPGTSISDTMNMAGIVTKGTSYGNDDGTTSRIIFYSDDADTSTYRPYITVYYTQPETNYGGAESLIVNSANGAKPVWTFDLSSAQASWDLDSIRGWFYILANYSVVGSEGPASVWNRVLKPINIGNNNGTQADAGEMHWNAWDERGSTAADSIWGTAGMNGTAGTYVNTCNRADTANAYDRFGYATSGPVYAGTSTGWVSAKMDTNNLRNWFDQQCNTFGLTLVGGVQGGDAGSQAFYKIEAAEKAGSSNIAGIVIYYHPGATTRGTGRFGRDNTGVYRNDR